MPDIEFVFPTLDGNSDEKDTPESSAHISEESSAEKISAEQLLSGIIDSRYVSLDNNDIDISQFPALRNALGLNPSENISAALLSEETDVLSPDIPDSTTFTELPKEEPIPSIFEGIGRSDWTSFERELLNAESETIIQAAEVEKTFVVEEENKEEAEDEEIIDTDYLLDYIDDIEFSGMDAEPLSPVKILHAPSDPYNSSFNNPDIADEELSEFDMTDKFVFEKK